VALVAFFLVFSQSTLFFKHTDERTNEIVNEIVFELRAMDVK
jgi:multisubunit Na+/H+ antiporter MnhB subunit